MEDKDDQSPSCIATRQRGMTDGLDEGNLAENASWGTRRKSFSNLKENSHNDKMRTRRNSVKLIN